MSGKTLLTAAVLCAGLLGGSAGALAIEGDVVVLHGLAVTNAAVVSRDEGGSGLTVHRGPPQVVQRLPADRVPVAAINGNRINVDNLEPVGNWFLDRSDGRLRIVHCYSRQSVNVGGKRRIRCNARAF